MLLFPLISFVSPFVWRYMPDFISMQLCLISLGLICGKLKVNLTPIILMSLGLLLKPTSIIVWFIFLLHPDFSWRKISPKFRSWRFYSFLAIPIVVTIFYYHFALKKIGTYADTKTLFYTSFRPPLKSLLDFFSHPLELYDLLETHLVVPYAFPLLCLVTFVFYFYKKQRNSILGAKMWLVIGLQIACIGMLDGTHAFAHYYYFAGVSPVAAALALTY